MPDRHAAPEFRAPRSDAERRALHRSTTLSFVPNDPDAMERYLALADPADLRIRLDEHARVTAGLVRLPMAHLLAGTRVPTLGIAAVSVPPEHRGTGAATAAMRAAITEARADAFPLATLFASTRALYRKAGFEPAGHLCRFRIPLETIGIRAADPAMRPATADDHDAIRACYRAAASHVHGALDRHPSIWHRIFHKGDTPREVAVVVERHTGAETVTGYVIYHVEQTPGDVRSQSLRLADVAFTTPDAGRRLLAYLSRFATLAHEAVFQCGPAAPLLQLLPENSYRAQQIEHWMLRIVDIPGAIEARAYPRALTTTFILDVADDLIRDNTGRFHVAIAGTRATVTPASKAKAPTIALDVRALAPLYTGFLSPHALRLAGLLEGEDDALAAAAPAFAGPAPTVMDFF